VTGQLLDTNTALIALSDPDRLPRTVRRTLLAGPNILSSVSYWEVVIKVMKGTLQVGDPRAWWHDALEQLAATPLPLRPEHVAELYSLPPLHKDPFDRILIAQALAGGLTLVTLDSEMPRYASARLRVIF
jgi:PIN domain nuclease of toxin-antitoxin system